MRLRKFALAAGLSLTLIASACSSKKPVTTNPWEQYGVTEHQYVTRGDLKPFNKTYEQNIDFDGALEKIIIKSELFRRGVSGNPFDYANKVQIYILRGEKKELVKMGGRETIIIGENTYHLTREFGWRGFPITERDVKFEDKVLKVQGREIVYDKVLDDFYFKKDLEEMRKKK
ncbi:MAG: hypothetical protein KKF46_05955 [Nanoarchaeota archaeon]|nr:hypothetical protein [Nanoarchaeota archaeon]MBU1321877.1 hypothetical protein [Nanoarchaeota archaeon]MBU1597652.1 hypothetical protein [Nanoarchaeota archaeon]MBU2442215.1 hypothetical protein [Nanoarchaeota archaeon]